MHSLPSDCPQRDERRGWMADAHLASEACICNFDMLNFYRKWIDDVGDVQNEETGKMEYPMAPKWFPFESIPWNAAYFIVPWNLYRHYGDTTVIWRHYAKMKAYFEYLTSTKTEDGLLKHEEPFNDWLSVAATNQVLVINYFYYMEAVIMTEFAKILGKVEDHAYYTGMQSAIAEAFMKKFQNHTGFGTQTGNVFPLWLNMIPQEDKGNFITKLLTDLLFVRGRTQLTTGILGTKYLIEVLSQIGRNDLVYDLFMRDEYPSWGFMLKNGATTIWERWEHMVGVGMNSHNHPALGAPDTWFYQELAGLKTQEIRETRRFFTISPYFCDKIDYVRAHMGSPWGRIAISWTRVNDDITICLDIPANTTAEIQLQLPGEELFHLDGDIPSDSIIQHSGNKNVIRLGSGHYDMAIRTKLSD
jgi:alpha-L-rhamnosidase